MRPTLSRTALVISLLVTMLLAQPAVGLGGDAPAGGKDFGKAMKSFIDAMVRKDPAAVLSFFSPQSPWRKVNYEIGSGRQLSAKMVDYPKMAGDFQKKQGWYGFFFDEPNGYTFRVNFLGGRMWKKKGPDTFVAPDSDTGKTYIKWRLDGGQPVIAEIGETGP